MRKEGLLAHLVMWLLNHTLCHHGKPHGKSDVNDSLLIGFRCITFFNGILLLCFAIHRVIIIRKESAGLSGLGLVKILLRDQAIYFLA